MFAQLGTWLQKKRNFLFFATLAVGLPVALTFSWILEAYGETLLFMFVIAISLCAGFVWSLLMWEFFRRRFPDWWGKVD